MITDTLGCNWSQSAFLLFSDNVFGQLIYYSHLFPLVVAVFIGLYVLFKNPKSTLVHIFFSIILAFSIWVFSDLVLWADADPSNIMFFWSVTILLEPVIYSLCLYFLIVFISGKDTSNKVKFWILILLLPTLVLLATRFSILGFDYTNCDREVIEGLLVYYGYASELIFVLWSAIYTVQAIFNTKGDKRKEVLLVGVGMFLFYVTFSLGNIVGSISSDWTLGQYGLFGMPIFLAFFSYLIVKFRIFHIKLIATQALVVSQIFLLLAILFIRKIENVRSVVIVTIILFLFLGYSLVRSVKREVQSREKIEIQEKELEKANARLKELDQLKSEFVSLATHQIRGPLTSIKGYASMMLEGDYGEVPTGLKEPVDTIYQSSQSLVVIVEDFLNVSRIEQGKMKYDFSTFDFCALVNEVVNEARPIIEKRGLNVSATICPAPVNVSGDRGKLKQVVGNLLDNSMKYTPKGSISLTLESDKTNKKVLLSIKDTGVGINAATIPHLFQKFSRAEDASQANILGTGLGLYVASEMIKAHRGKIWVESPGVGKGATFFVELKLV